ncbi:hypothetical protein ACFY3G_51940 [Streptomyces phaeochromogenes]|uniref:hypothetical protein n=1 Tax=Streptomyces phaeochromogenes TaxID=1923 RepID=UPI00368B0F8F
MRFRHAVGAAVGALALIVTVPTSANAVDGNFFYQYGDSANPTAGTLENPQGSECINIPEVEGKPSTAFSPKNQLPDADAMVYSEEDCSGVGTKLDPDTELGPAVKFKSVIFEVA